AHGLAAMYAPSAVARPLVDVPRARVAAYAASRGLPVADDPSNAGRAHLRNRVRLDLLPALERAHPGFGEEMLAVSRRAAAWRAGVEALVDRIVADGADPASGADGRRAVVAAAALEGLPGEGLAILWPAIAGRAGVALDWRGTERLAAFTNDARSGQQVPLSGGVRVRRTATSFVLEAAPQADPLY
ncbi:MAG: hypothetical protein HYR75_03695, partial [Gemmatimonadetes bacterium]|nr:hypothetical protein [Gemmatimonadota bacterium]